MNQAQKVQFLVSQNYEEFKAWFVDNANKRKPLKIMLTNNFQYIFVCKFKVDCIIYLGTL